MQEDKISVIFWEIKPDINDPRLCYECREEVDSAILREMRAVWSKLPDIFNL